MHLPTRLAPLLQRFRLHPKSSSSIPSPMFLGISSPLHLLTVTGIVGILSLYGQCLKPEDANQLQQQTTQQQTTQQQTTQQQTTQQQTTQQQTTQTAIVQSVQEQPGQSVNVLITGLSLTELSRTVQQAQAGQPSQVFIVERSGALVAASTLVQPLWLRGEPHQLKAAASRDPMIRLTTEEIERRYGGFAQLSGQQQFDFKLNGKLQYVQVTPYSDDNGLDWLIVTTVPSSAWAIQPPNGLFMLLVVLGIPTAVAVYLSRNARPMACLNETSPPIAQSTNFPANRPSVDVDRVQEFATSTKSIARMFQEVQQSRLTLEEYSQLLEQKVYERTQALEAEIQRRTAIEAVLYEANRELERIAFIDGLTQVANRRHFDDCLNQEWWRLRRDKAPLSIILCDLDYFKQYNDTYGHQAGDDCLCKVAIALQSTAKRPGDIVARYGGEEFAIILPDTPAAGAIQVAHEIQIAIEQLQIPHRGSIVSPFVTLSLGIASMVPQVGASPQQMLVSADLALYQAKSKGRNSIAVDNLKLETNDRRLA